MNKKIFLKCVLTSVACLSVSACATVDVTRMTQSNVNASDKVENINVVQEAASKLYAVFTNRGFVAKDSRRNMRSAARMLLKGLEDKPLNTTIKYSERLKSESELQSDIILATEQVDLTRKAAEVYLAMAPGEASLKRELGSLQKALVASNEAKKSFSDARDGFDKTLYTNAFSDYKISVQKLRNVTDAFGYRVRSVALATADNTKS